MQPDLIANACPPERREAILARYRERTAASLEAHRRAERVLPGGINRNILYHKPHPLFVASGRGAVLTDLDGNDYLDFNGNYTSMILGNCVPEVMAAVHRQVDLGTAWAGGSVAEADLAELLVDRLPSADTVRFTASGSEAAMLALRAARAHTKRPVIAKMEGGYHGLGDYAMVSVAPPLGTGPDTAPQSAAAPGIPEAVRATVLTLPFNDLAATEALIAKHGASLAAVIVEPVVGSGGVIPPRPGYLQLLRRLADEHGIVLIFDEVISFRLHPGGAQTLFGVTPDLTVLGKIIGGGYPIGAVAGKSAIMRRFDPSQPDAVTLSGTFHANPVALAAGLASMKLLTPSVIDDLNRRSEAMAKRAAAVLARARLPLQLNAIGSLIAIHATAAEVTDYRKAAGGARDFVQWLYLALLNEGVLLSPRGMGCVSAAMQPADLDRFVAALEAALAATGALGRKVEAGA